MTTQTERGELVADEKIRLESGETWVLSYYVPVFSGEDGEEIFGLRVEKKSPEGDLLESEETPPLTADRDEIFAMARAFARGSVPPVTLLEMADEWAGANA